MTLGAQVFSDPFNGRKMNYCFFSKRGRKGNAGWVWQAAGITCSVMSLPTKRSGKRQVGRKEFNWKLFRR